jgi:AcrR family transcriptional regulator
LLSRVSYPAAVPAPAPTARSATPASSSHATGSPAAPTGTSATRSREAMILAAERLFAERGVAAVSLREIGAAAGQRNNSAAQYHFGSKPGLVEAIFAFRMTAINARREAALAELDASGRPDEVRGLVEAYIRPLAESLAESDGERWYLRFLARVAADPDLRDRSRGDREFTAGIDEVVRRLDLALADVPQPIRDERLQAVATLLVNTLAAIESGDHDPALVALLTADLADMATALLTAPVSPATSRLLDSLAPSSPPTDKD